MIWLLSALALAQDPPAEPPPADEPEPTAAEPAPEPAPPPVVEDDIDAEMTVYGELAIVRALDSVVAEMERLGYRAKRSEDRIVFKPPLGWMGAAIIEDGQLSFRRSVAGLAGPDDSVNMELFRRIDPETSASAGYGLRMWLLPSEKKVEPLRAEVIEAIGPSLSRYNAVVARTALQERLATLPDRLDAVWRDGTPLVGVDLLATPEARRRHVLEYWASRASTPEGRLTARAVADWLEAVVQSSADPVTRSERTEFENQRDDGLTLPR